MRFFSIAAFAGLAAATHVAGHQLEARDSDIHARTYDNNSNHYCEAGKTWSNGRCTDCSGGSYSLGGYNAQCKSCPTGSTSSSCESFCVCKPGFYINGGKTTTNACNACSAGYSSGQGSSGCSKCPSNTYSSPGGTCTACPAGHVSDAGSATCSPKCSAGTYLSNGTCRPCSAGSYSSAGATSCSSCPAGTFSASNGASSCATCPAGTTCGAGSTSCQTVNCPPGKYISNGSCANCPGGSYSAGSNAASCSVCPANTFSTGGASSCTSCPSGTSCLSGSTQCSSGCKAGQFTDGNKCSTCPAGWFSKAGDSSCSDCPEDTYSSAGAGSCTQCPAGKGCGGRSTTPNQCVDKCKDGKVYSNGRCQDCPAGKYSNNNMCSDCPAGTISEPGSKTCSICPGGSVPAPNGKSCTSCPRNTFSSGDNCSPCPAGSTSNPGSSSCGPQPSKRAQPVLASNSMCSGAGMMRCDVYYGAGGSECIDVMSTLDSCGGCVDPEGANEAYTGRDCSAIPNVNDVKCTAGRCNITSCRSGYEPSGGFCVPVKGGAGKNATGHVKRGMFSRHDTF